MASENSANFTRTTLKPKRRRKEENRGEKKKKTRHTHNFYIADFGTSFSNIQVDICITNLGAYIIVDPDVWQPCCDKYDLDK